MIIKNKIKGNGYYNEFTLSTEEPLSKKTWFSSIFLSLALISLSSVPATKTYASGVNMEGLGIRAMSMGSAFIGLADDASAVFWNPAGLSQLKGAGYTFGVYSMTADVDAKNGVSNNSLPGGDYDPNKGDLFPGFYPSEPTNFDDDEELWLGAATMPSFLIFKNFGRYTLAGGAFGVGGAYSSYNDKIFDPANDAEIEADVFAVLGLMSINGSIGYQVTQKLSVGFGVAMLRKIISLPLAPTGTITTMQKYVNGVMVFKETLVCFISLMSSGV